YYVNYLKFMERARTEFFRELGFGKAGANKESYQFVVHSAQIEYKRPAMLDDMLEVSARLVKLRGASLFFEQEVRRNEEILSLAEVKIACVDGASLRPVPLPFEVLTKLDL
ncbi:MAG: YbgC/FadM family acyl-CoA thioesterase, partial [Pseudomonadales bacterium]